MYTLMHTSSVSQRKQTMFAVVVFFHVKSTEIDWFMPRLRENAQTSLAREPDCHRFDVCTDPARPNEVLLYELYTDASAFQHHLGTPHFKEFDATTDAMINEKRVLTYEKVE